MTSVNEWIARLSQVPPSERWRQIMEDDMVAVGEKKAALDIVNEIRNQGKPFVIVPDNLVAFDGRDIRAFEPVWAQLVAKLKLTGTDKINPISFGSESISHSLEQLLAIQPKTGGFGSGFLWAALVVTGLMLLGGNKK